MRLLDGAIAKTPRDPELLRLRAAAREGAGDDEGAVADLLSIGKDAASVDLVIETLSRIVQRNASPATDTYAIALSDLLLGAARLEQAQGTLDRLLARNPRHADALERTAALAARRGLWDRAADAYGRLLPVVVAQRPADPGHLAEVGLALADAYERAGRPGAARVHLESVLRMQPESAHLADLSVEAGIAWSRLLAKVGRAREALPVLVDVVARNRGKRLPELGAFYLEIGKAYLATDDLVEAFNVLKTGFAVDPRCTELALVLGLLASDLDDDKTAERALLAVAMPTTRDKISNGSAVAAHKVRALYQLAAMADAKGEVTKAHRWATAAAREDPTHTGARALLDKVGTRARPVGRQMR
jgi:tetratricopeptide (TPR) repeat protein